MKIRTLIILAVSFVLFGCKSEQGKNTKTETVDKAISKIEILDFHSTHRCMTCNAIEDNTRYTLATYFASELKNGKISFQTVNVDEKENEALAEKFQASGTALFLNVIKNGEEKQVNLTDFAFIKGTDQLVFSTELKEKIESELTGL